MAISVDGRVEGDPAPAVDDHIMPLEDSDLRLHESDVALQLGDRQQPWIAEAAVAAHLPLALTLVAVAAGATRAVPAVAAGDVDAAVEASGVAGRQLPHLRAQAREAVLHVLHAGIGRRNRIHETLHLLPHHRQVRLQLRDTHGLHAHAEAVGAATPGDGAASNGAATVPAVATVGVGPLALVVGVDDGHLQVDARAPRLGSRLRPGDARHLRLQERQVEPQLLKLHAAHARRPPAKLVLALVLALVAVPTVASVGTLALILVATATRTPGAIAAGTRGAIATLDMDATGDATGVGRRDIGLQALDDGADRRQAILESVHGARQRRDLDLQLRLLAVVIVVGIAVAEVVRDGVDLGVRVVAHLHMGHLLLEDLNLALQARDQREHRRGQELPWLLPQLLLLLLAPRPLPWPALEHP
mmetsp:Transcript_12941/g.33297  ORF Transcript_12941/g.33297 Transcript_12941/m.33297 type:complete len:416 (-) Transcript_12941:5-1252(-)